MTSQKEWKSDTKLKYKTNGLLYTEESDKMFRTHTEGDEDKK